MAEATENDGINSGSLHGSRHGEGGSYFHRTGGGGSRIRGGSAMITNYSGHGLSSSSHGPLRNPKTRVVVAPPPSDGADAGVEVEVAPNAAGAEVGLEVEFPSSAASEDELSSADDEIFEVERPAWVDDPDAGLPVEERKYNEFTRFLDFWRLLDFWDVLKSKSRRSEPNKREHHIEKWAEGGTEKLERAEELDRMMRETEGKDRGNTLGRFLDVLMRRDVAQGKKDDAAFDDFLRTLDSDVVKPNKESEGEEWSAVVEGMSPDDEKIDSDVLLQSYWKCITEPDYRPEPPAEAPAGWMHVLRSLFGYGKSAGNGAGAGGEEAAGAELATGVKHGEGDEDTVRSLPSLDPLV